MAGRSVPAPLPVWEQQFYWVTEGVTVVYMLGSLYRASDDARRKDEPIHIEEGWAVLGRPMDNADFEWIFWSSYFLNLLPWICGHVLLSCTVTRHVSTAERKAVVCAIYGFLATSYLLGFGTMMVFLVLPVVLYLVSKLGSAKAVWLTSLLFLTFLNFGENALLQWAHDYHPGTDVDGWFYVCIFAWGSLFQRATAFALECVWARQSRSAPAPPPAQEIGAKGINNPTDDAKIVVPPLIPNPLPLVPGWLDLFLYIFYFPFFFTGPLLIYNKFHRQFQEPQPWTGRRLVEVVWKLARVLFWAWMNFVLVHFVYPHAINNNTVLLAQQSRWTIAAIGYSLGQLFMVKYLVFFGLPAQLARLDGFEPPAVPACISYIYCYSDMWRSFDRGLYDFMTRYIFIPLGGSQAGLAYRLTGSILCFAFVYYWHGAEYYLFLWCVLNFVETSLEQVGGWLEKTDVVKHRVYDKLSPAAIRRVRAVMSVPVFLMSVFAIFYFFGGTGSGAVFLRKLLIDIPWDCFVLFLMLVYCAIQNAMEIERLRLTKLRATKRRD
ncbi:hypothetical protein ACOMHN_021669 [Nucella lapillus]